ncbi:MAG: family glycosyltransferase, 4-amino-4-deoxy-L-arabinose transferase [Acidimicrobiales bacterium]|nr:family glycosyltransferase, 4-amino-4-deoxy-L-arabinose transferase [Acidimicrobiales bacterium]
MSLASYLAGTASWAVAAVALAFAAWRLRARVAPALVGPIARLAEIVLGLTLLIVVLQVLGVAGLLSRVVVAVVVPAAAAAVALAAGRPRRASVDRVAVADPVSPSGAVDRDASPARSTYVALAAVGLVVIVVAQWFDRSVFASGGTLRDFDTLRYHGPFAATWVQQHGITHVLHTSSEAQETFFPANAELYDTYGILTFGGDLLTPFRNVAWLVLSFFAAWCAGRRVGSAWAAVAAMAVVWSTPLLSSIEPASAKTDVVAVALLVAAAALLLHALPRGDGPPDLAVLGIAGLAAGLAVGTKLTVLVPLGIVATGAVLAVGRGRRMRALGVLAGSMFVTGGFWFVRNLAWVGNPLPWYRLGVGRYALPQPPMEATKTFGFSIAHYATSSRFWLHTAPTGLTHSFGEAWPVVVLAAIAAAVAAAVVQRRGTPDRGLRVVGAGALGAMASYLVTPYSAGGPDGNPRLFELDLRFLAPALALAAVSVARVRRRERVVAGAALLVVLEGFDGLHRSQVAITVALAATLVAGLAAWRSERFGQVGRSVRSRRLAGVTGAVVAMAVLVPGVWAMHRHDARTRWTTKPSADLAAAYHVIRDVKGARIGVGGFALTYPLYGSDVSNRVQFIGIELPHAGFRTAQSCSEWQAALRRGRFDYVVVARSPVAHQRVAPERGWTARYPGASVVFERRVTTVFRLRPTSAGRSGACGTSARSPATSGSSGKPR